MKHTRETVVGAAALLAAGVVGIGSADAASAAQPQAKPARITSDQQLAASVKQAAAIAGREAGLLSCCPQGQASAGVHVHTPACSVSLPYREEDAAE
jgi:hypothetical protein